MGAERSQVPQKDVRREPARRFEDLVVWQKAHEFALAVYALTRTFPKEEVFGLTSQLRRAALCGQVEEVSRLLQGYSSAIRASGP